jgi:hypothetical protein
VLRRALGQAWHLNWTRAIRSDLAGRRGRWGASRMWRPCLAAHLTAVGGDPVPCRGRDFTAPSLLRETRPVPR